MSVFDERRAELEQHEFMMGRERGRLAVALDLLTDSLIMVGQHGVYCNSTRNPSKPALDLQAVLSGMEGAKALIQNVMEELRARREAELKAEQGELPQARGPSRPDGGTVDGWSGGALSSASMFTSL
jgi:hypothetical protein